MTFETATRVVLVVAALSNCAWLAGCSSAPAEASEAMEQMGSPSISSDLDLESGSSNPGSHALASSSGRPGSLASALASVARAETPAVAAATTAPPASAPTDQAPGTGSPGASRRSRRPA